MRDDGPVEGLELKIVHSEDFTSGQGFRLLETDYSLSGKYEKRWPKDEQTSGKKEPRLVKPVLFHYDRLSTKSVDESGKALIVEKNYPLRSG